MALQPDRRRIARVSSVTMIVVAILVLIGWVTGISVLRSGVPELPEMVPNTALMLLLAGIALFLETIETSWSTTVVAVLACVMLAMGFATLCEYLFHFDAGIDRLLMPAGDVTAPSGYVGRMSPHTSTAFGFLGLAFLTLRNRTTARLSEVLTFGCLIIAFTALLGHVYGAQRFYGISNVNSMAVHTAALLIICCVGLFAVNTEIPMVAILTSRGPGGVTARWFASAVIVVPLLIDVLREAGENRGFYDEGFGSALAQVVRTIIMCSFVFFVAAKIYRLDVQRITAETDLAEKEQRFRELFENGQSNICIHDLDGIIINVNPAVLRVMGYEANEMIGRNLVDFLPEGSHQLFPAFLRQIEHEGIASGNFPVVTRSGKQMVWQYQSILISEPGRDPYVLGYAQDVTDLTHATRKLRELSLTDELTGLLNRRGFQTLAEQQIKLEGHSGTARGLTLMFADLDGLKQINDQYGHDAGSKAIVDFGMILKSALRDADLIARWGGDEFVILTIGSAGESANLITERIQTAIADHNATSDDPFELRCSVGVTSVRAGQTFETLISEADEAMYRDKRRRKNPGV